ncbi:MAG: hypothetical protein V7K27_12930 [Nostoc sp.]
MAKPDISNAFAIAVQSQIFLPPVQHCLSPLALNFNSLPYMLCFIQNPL